MDVVLYMRYSSDRQTEQSIEGQRRICKAFCEQQGYNIVREYVDRATSAFKDTDKRTQFQQMIRDSEKNLWNGVVVYKLDRFARNRYDSATFKAKLKKNGVRVISATENISDNPEGVILESVLEGMAEFYSKELSQKVRRGRLESANKCQSIGGSIPLGYKIENKKFVIDEAKAEIVREAFSMYANGSTIADICQVFNEKGYRSAKGSEFNKNSFKAIFKNERYIGIYKYKDMKIENGMPAIIDKETFDTVQKKLKANGAAPARSKAKVDYMLAQKIFCGHCGSPMVGECGRSANGETYHYYTCSAKKRKLGCDKRPLRKELIERWIAEDIFERLTPENIELLADMAIEQNRIDAEMDGLVPALQGEIKECENGIANIVKMVERGADSPALTNRINELEKQKRAAERRLADAQSEVVVLEREQIVWWLSGFLEGDINDEEFRRSLLDMLLYSVTVWDEPDGWYRFEVCCNLAGKEINTFRVNSNVCSDMRCSVSPRKRTCVGKSFFS